MSAGESSYVSSDDKAAAEKAKPKRTGFGLFKPKPKTPESTEKSGFGMFGGSSPKPEEAAVEESETIEQDTKQEHELAEEAADAEVEEIEENQVTFEDRMRNTLRTLGVEVEDDDDWKQMVIKTRLTLKDLKDSFINNKGTKIERTKKMIIVLNDENVVEVQFRLDFAHWTPPNLELRDPDELEIEPDLEDLETPVNPEKPLAKKKRLKRIIKAITKAQKLNKKRLKRLEEKRLLKEQEEAEAAEREAAEKEEAARKAAEEGEQADAEQQDGEDGPTKEGEEEGEEGEEEEEDDRNVFDKIEDATGVRVIFKTDVLEGRLLEYKEIFFGPDLTEEEIAELEKIAADDKDFYIHLKFLVRKKTWEEKEAERIAAEEEAKRKAEEEEAKRKAEEAGEELEDDEDIELEEIDERKREKRKELNEKLKIGQSDDETVSSMDGIAYDNVPIT